MRNSVIISAFLLSSTFVFSQETETKKVKDTIKTEVVNVVTSYTPTISDAFKIKKNPTIKMGSKTQKKKLQYEIFSAPVASTFIPKSGVAKGIDLGVKERLYNNYLAAGFGNNTTPFFEAFLHHSTRFENDFGLYAKYISSVNSVKNTPLDNGFSNIHVGTYYMQKERYFDWKVGADFKRDQYNWYGLPSSITYTPTTISAIKELQTYTNFDAFASVQFEDSYIKDSRLDIGYFADDYKSKELRIAFKPQFQFPLYSLGRNFNDLEVAVLVDYLTGSFEQTYANAAKSEHGFFTIGANPKYHFNYNDFTFKIGTKLYLASDLENKNNQFFIYPDIQITYPILANHINFYLGAGGDLTVNSYESFVAENPFISPTQNITQTNEKYNFFGGFNGKLSSNISYDIKATYGDEEDKALFVRNNSKSDGTTSTNLKGYEFGNSFSVIYDDVKTLSLSGELTVDVSKNLVMGIHGEFNKFTLKNQTTAWNLPKLKGEFFGKYSTTKWYAGATVFYVDKQYDVTYTGTYPSATNGKQTLKSYTDVNLNGGYHFNDKFTIFLKLNNVLNTDYERHANFAVQGFQVLGGVSYKFDF